MKVHIKYLQSETAMSRLLQSQIRSVRFYFHLPHHLLISLAIGKHYLRCTNTKFKFPRSHDNNSGCRRSSS